MFGGRALQGRRLGELQGCPTGTAANRSACGQPSGEYPAGEGGGEEGGGSGEDRGAGGVGEINSKI